MFVSMVPLLWRSSIPNKKKYMRFLCYYRIHLLKSKIYSVRIKFSMVVSRVGMFSCSDHTKSKKSVILSPIRILFSVLGAWDSITSHTTSCSIGGGKSRNLTKKFGKKDKNNNECDKVNHLHLVDLMTTWNKKFSLESILFNISCVIL